jgi:hypothetical protein
MSKKQLRMIKKTVVNKAGQVELVNPWGKPDPPVGNKLNVEHLNFSPYAYTPNSE